MSATAAKPHALYRFFAEDGALLYVGITNNPARRFTQHGVDREWWHEVETIRMERHPDREAVLIAEKLAIQTERPRYNVIHAGGAPVTTELPTSGPAGDYPIAAGDVVALALAPNHHGEAECPVGIALEVSRFGAKLALLRWHIEMFDGPETLIPWHRVMEIRWAPVLSESEALRRGYAPAPSDAPPVFDCDELAYFQTKWTHGKERAKEDAQRKFDRQRG